MIFEIRHIKGESTTDWFELREVTVTEISTVSAKTLSHLGVVSVTFFIYLNISMIFIVILGQFIFR